MEEFNITAFTNRLKRLILDSNQFPYMRDEELDKAKHPRRNPLHLKEALDNTAVITGSGTTLIFDFGSESLENSHPYYHILQQAPYIRKRGKGNDKSKGSQAKVEDVGRRDYERISWNGKTFTKKYSKNIRGSRNRITKVSHWTEDYSGKRVFVNRDSNEYQNIHYKYIDNILNTSVVDTIAMEFNLKRGRTMNGGLEEELSLQQYNDLFDVFSSLRG